MSCAEQFPSRAESLSPICTVPDIFKSSSASSQASNRTIMKQSPRPWQRGSDEPLRYLWRSSIPEKWIALRGQQHFHQVRDLRPRGSFDPVKSRQEFLNSLLDSNRGKKDKILLTSSKSNTKVCFSLRETPDLEEMQQQFVQAEEGARLHLPRISDNICSKSPGRQSPLLQVQTLAFNSNGRSTPTYVVNKYSRPRALVPVPKVKSSTNLRYATTLDKFLDRFAATSRPELPSRKGVSGWKLAKPKPAKGESLTTRREVPLRPRPVIVPDNPRDEPYLQFLTWKEGGD